MISSSISGIFSAGYSLLRCLATVDFRPAGDPGANRSTVRDYTLFAECSLRRLVVAAAMALPIAQNHWGPRRILRAWK